MNPWLILLLVVLYFAVLIGISYLTGGGSDNKTFFTGNRNSPWYVVAFGMIGASLSGVTFISVPGWVQSGQFSYMQMVLGYLLGYIVIAQILLPLYYRLNLTSIYTYLEGRFGVFSYKTGAVLFMLSRTIGAACRLYLVAEIFQYAVFEQLEVDMPFFVTVLITIGLIWIYTYRSGIKTIIYTDTLQTAFMLLAVVFAILAIKDAMGLSMGGLITELSQSEYTTIWFFDDANSASFFWKQFFSGAFITIVMTGLDQDMMQKNLTCKNLKDAQKNMYWFSGTLVLVNLIFLSLGSLLLMYSNGQGIPIPEKGDQLFPMLALGGELPMYVGVLFIIGLIAAAYSSADSALTSLTTSFCVDILGLEKREVKNAKQTRIWVHIGFSLVLTVVILILKSSTKGNIIQELFAIAGYTYGPLLGLYAFGLFTRWKPWDKGVPVLSVLSPLLCGVINENSEAWFSGYTFGFELLILNGVIMFVGLLFLSIFAPKKQK